jgi:hypothetical protein
VHSIFVDGPLAYLADVDAGAMRVFDVSQPARAVEIGRYARPEPGAFVHDLMVGGGRCYLNYWDQGFDVLDCTDPTRPRELGRYRYARMTSHSSWVGPIGGRLVALHGDEDYGGHLRLLDVTDPAAGVALVGEWQTRPEVSVHNVMLVGTTAYLAHYQDGLRVLDVSDPARPRPVAYANTWSFAGAPGSSFYEGALGIDVDPAARLIYVADSARGLLIYRASF